jgi:hypothetical protein
MGSVEEGAILGLAQVLGRMCLIDEQLTTTLFK